MRVSMAYSLYIVFRTWPFMSQSPQRTVKVWM